MPDVTIEPGFATDTTAIKAVLDDRRAAHRGKDAKRFVSHYAPDIVSFDLAPPLAVSGSAVLDIDGWDAWYQTWRGGVDCQIAAAIDHRRGRPRVPVTASTGSEVPRRTVQPPTFGSAPHWPCAEPTGAGKSSTSTTRRLSTWTAPTELLWTSSLSQWA